MKYLYTLGSLILLLHTSSAQWPNIYDNQKVAYLPGSSHNQVVIADNNGGCYVIWQDARDQVNIDQVYAQHFDSTGTPSWTINGIPLSPTGKLQNHMAAISDGQGGAFVIWRDLRDTTSLPTSTGPDIWGQHIDQTGTLWGNGKALIMEPGEQGAPLMVPDQSGGFLFSFEDGGDFQASRSEGYWMQRVDANGVAQWSSGGELVHKQSSSFSTSIDLALASDGQNGAVLVYNESAFDPNTGNNIYGHRMNQSGIRMWTPVADTIAGIVIERGYPISVEPGTQNNPRIDLDDEGNIIVCWEDKRDPSWQFGALFAQRIQPDGSFLWNTNAIQISPSGMGAANRFEIAADKHGGVYFEYSTSGHADHDLIRYKLNGTADWTSPVNISNNMTYNSTLVPTGSGGVAIAWLATGINQPGTEDGIMAQLFDTTGAVSQAGGILMSSYPEDKGPVALAVDGQGELFASWIDFRRTNGQSGSNADADLFVQGLFPQTIGTWELENQTIDFYAIPRNDGMSVYFEKPMPIQANLKLFDLHGRMLAHTNVESGIKELFMPISLSTGVYIISLEGRNYSSSRKVVYAEVF
jgi:hypothetical protein